MAESTLSLTRDDLREEVGLKLGYGLNVSGWTPDQIARIDICVRDGLSDFYFPITGESKTVYEWSFLTPTATIDTVIGQQPYDLPEDCGGIIDQFVVSNFETSGWTESTVIPVVTIEELLQLAATEAASNGQPRMAAIRPKSTTPTVSVSQRYEVLLYPIPSEVVELSYKYPVHVDSIGTTDAYLPGGASHSRTIVTACLAVSEQFFAPDEQTHQQAFQQRLQASIEYDKRNQQTKINPTWAITEPTYGTWNWFKREVSGYLLGQWNITLLTHAENAQVESLVQRGLQRFYYPPGARQPWSFLTPMAVITTSNTVAAYDLPAGFSGLIGEMTLPDVAGKPLRQITESELRSCQVTEATAGDPEYVCIREKTSSNAATHTGSAVFLYEAVFFPTPDAGTGDVVYRYKVSPAVLSSSVTYPYGSNIHAESMRQAMIALASEIKQGAEQQAEWQKFQQSLSGSMMADIDVDIESDRPQPQSQRQLQES